MTRSELVTALLGQTPGLTHDQARRTVDALLETVADALVEGRRVELRGIGAFAVTTRPARATRNPCTGVSVATPRTWHVAFRTGSTLRDRLNPPEK